MHRSSGSRRSRAAHCALVAGALVLSLAFGAADASATAFRAVLLGANYPGGKTHDDDGHASAVALQQAMFTWKNWRAANVAVMDPATTAAQFTAKITEEGNKLEGGDGLYVFYFGHLFQGGTAAGHLDQTGQPIDEGEQSANVWDESLHFQDHSILSDDELTATLSALPAGLKVTVTLIGCWSEGFWNGNDNVGATGDLSTRNDTVLMYAAEEDQLLGRGGVGPRPDEPLYLARLIANAQRGNRKTNLPIHEWHAASDTSDAGIGGRFDASDPGWDLDYEWQADSGIAATSGADDFELFLVPEPSTAGLLLLGLAGLRAARLRRA